MLHVIRDVKKNINTRKEVEDIKKPQIKLLEIKNTIFERKILLNEFHSILNTKEENTCELEDLAT